MFEYLAGALVTIVTFAIARVFYAYRKEAQPLKITYTQSKIHSLILDGIYGPKKKPFELKTQATKHVDKDKVTVLILEDNAYWIKDNSVYQGIMINGNVDQENIKKLDTMDMDKVELNKLSYIVEMLTKGEKNDRSNPGYPKL
jgi:hypothetical protein